MSYRLKILEEMRDKLRAEVARLEPLMTYNPKVAFIKLHTSEFPALLKKYVGEQRFTKEFNDELNAIATREEELKKESEGFDAIAHGDKICKELVAAQMELQDVEREIYFLRAKP